MPVDVLADIRREGSITELTGPDSGIIKEDVTNQKFDFNLLGVHSSFFVGENVIFFTLRTPGGKEIVKQVIKK